MDGWMDGHNGPMDALTCSQHSPLLMGQRTGSMCLWSHQESYCHTSVHRVKTVLHFISKMVVYRVCDCALRACKRPVLRWGSDVRYSV